MELSKLGNENHETHQDVRCGESFLPSLSHLVSRCCLEWYKHL